MLVEAPGLAYIHEPFNPVTPPGICAAPFDHMYTYVTEANELLYRQDIERTLEFRYGFRKQARALRSIRESTKALRDAALFTRARFRRARPLIKDPTAIFSAEWLAERFAMQVVLVIRHPAAVVSSLVRLGWKPRFGPILADKRLMSDHLSAFEAEISALVSKEQGLVQHGTLLWRLVYQTALTFKAAHPDWVFIRHEDFSRAPLPEFARLYTRLGLQFTPQAEAHIEEHSRRGNPVEISHPHAITADSEANLWNWKERLSAAEIVRIRRSVEDVSHSFYSDEDW
jgi:hypothetical protein